jgi:hypothetical protein
MTFSRKAGSQAGWALISGGVNAARVETHRLHQLVEKVLRLVENSSEKEHLYQVAGDLILGIPKRIERIEQQLDETGYALSIMGKEHLKDRLPLSQRALVEETVEGVPAFGVSMRRDSVARVLERYIAQRVARRHAESA